MCAGLPAVCDKIGLTVDQDDSEEVPGLVNKDNDSDTVEGAFGQLQPDYFRPEEDRSETKQCWRSYSPDTRSGRQPLAQ